MKRDEYIEHLKKLHEEGGDAALQPLVEEAIEKQGPVHEVEWHECPGTHHFICGTITDESNVLCVECRQRAHLYDKRSSNVLLFRKSKRFPNGLRVTIKGEE